MPRSVESRGCSTPQPRRLVTAAWTACEHFAVRSRWTESCWCWRAWCERSQVTARLLDLDASSHPAPRKAALLISGNVDEREESYIVLLAQVSLGIIRASYDMCGQERGASFPSHLLSCEVAACFSCSSKYRAAKRQLIRARMNWPAMGVCTYAQARWCWRCACSSSSCCHISRSTRKVQAMHALIPNLYLDLHAFHLSPSSLPLQITSTPPSIE